MISSAGGGGGESEVPRKVGGLTWKEVWFVVTEHPMAGGPMLCAAALKTGEVVQWLEDTLKDHVRDLGKLAGPSTELSSDVLGS